MGLLSSHPIERLRVQCDLSYFVETGTWRGDGLLAALGHSFVHLWSIEASPSLAIEAAARLRAARSDQHRWTILVGDSAEQLPALLSYVGPGGALWWLDAHLPERYGARATRLPLEAELRAVVGHARSHAGDVFLIDDWRLYERGPYQSGDFPGGPPGDGAAIRGLLGMTHALRVDPRGEGALVATPLGNAVTSRED